MQEDKNFLDSHSKVAVVIPAFKVNKQILDVISQIGPEVGQIIVVDDGCPELSGELVVAHSGDSRVSVIFHGKNLGVGAAVITGYVKALEEGAQIIVKVDGDGQMDLTKLLALIQPIMSGAAGYAKGNRFTDIEGLRLMPKNRILGNLVLSFLAKLSTGYWGVFDPNNGFTAISAHSLSQVPLHKVDGRYFFESDMLFRLGLANIKVQDIAMPSIYGSEVSNLKIRRVLIEFPFKHTRNFFKRILYTYFLRDFNLASLELLLGTCLMVFGAVLGIENWLNGVNDKQPTPPGTLILVAMSMLSGLQFLLAFFSFDMLGKARNS